MNVYSEKWVYRFLGLATLYSSFSKDPSTKVGCVIVNPKGIVVGLGYNGFSRNREDSEELLNEREKKYPRTIHAEENAIFNKTGDIEGCAAFLTHPPCVPCISRLSQNGITKVYYIKPAPSFASRWNLGESAEEMDANMITHEGIDASKVESFFVCALEQEAKVLNKELNGGVDFDFQNETVERY